MAQAQSQAQPGYNALRAQIWQIAADPERSEAQVIQHVLDLVGPALDVSRACYNRREEDKISCILEWCEPGVSPSVGASLPAFIADHFADAGYAEITVAHALERLPAAIRPVARPLFTAMAKTLSLEAVYIVPYEVGGEIEGFVTFDICTGKKRKEDWSDDERAVVSDAVQIIGNIIARKRAEERLRRSEADHRTLVENLNIGVYRNTGGPQGRFLKANPAIARMFGYATVEEFMDCSVAHLYQDPEERAAFVAEATGQGYVKDRELRLRKKDGTPIWCSCTARVHYDESGAIAWMDGVIEDITERKRMEGELQESEEKYRNLVELNPNAVVILQDNCYQYVNSAFEQIFGYSLDDVARDFSFFRLVKEEDRPMVRDRYERRLAGEVMDPALEIDLIAKDGTIKPCRTCGRRITYRGRPADLVVITDLTEQKQAENRLRQAEKMQAIGQLAGGIAHDFNNRLVSILGFAQLLAQDCQDAQLQDYANRIVKGSQRAKTLTSQLLAFARKGDYESIPVDLHGIMDEVMMFLEHSLDKRIHIKRDYGAQHPITRGDPAQLQNVFLNLALNARDAMPEGGELRFRTEAIELDDAYCRQLPYQLTPGPYVRVCVQDTGMGMDEETQRHIFEPFFTTKRPGEGTGMGLAAAYGTIKNHGGAIEVESAPDRGATFRIYLPLTTGTDAGEETAVPVAPVHMAHILVVDDEEDVLETASALLKKMGYAVTTCPNGPAAIEAFRQTWQEIDLVLLDMVMPEMDGVQVFRALRAIHPGAKVILSSGYSMEDDARALRDQGVVTFIQKPFEMGELSQVLADALKPNP